VPAELRSGQAGIATLNASILQRFMQDIHTIPAAMALAEHHGLMDELRRVGVLEK
jgi:hypothetical protein